MCKILTAKLWDWYTNDRPGYLVKVYAEGERPLFIKSVYRNAYTFTHDPIYAKHFSYRTAKLHIANLLRKGEI